MSGREKGNSAVFGTRETPCCESKTLMLSAIRECQTRAHRKGGDISLDSLAQGDTRLEQVEETILYTVWDKGNTS